MACTVNIINYTISYSQECEKRQTEKKLLFFTKGFFYKHWQYFMNKANRPRLNYDLNVPKKTVKMQLAEVFCVTQSGLWPVVSLWDEES